MANVKITDLSNYPTVLSSSSDVLAIVDVTNNITKKITVDNLFAGRASSGVGAGGGTVTSVTVQAPQGMFVNGATQATITNSGIFTLSFNQANGFIPLTVLATNSGSASSGTYLCGDSTWKALPIPSGSVQSVALTMPSVFQVTNPLVTTTGTLTAVWDGFSGGKIPPLNLGGNIPSGQTVTNCYLRADGSWQPPVGQGIGTVSSIALTVPQGLLINGTNSATNTSNTPFALTWDPSTTIPLSVLGNNLPDNEKFLSGTGWVQPQSVSQQFKSIRIVGTLASTAVKGSLTIILTGQYTTIDLPSLQTIFFGANASLPYTIASISATILVTTVTLTSPLLETHFLGASVYKYGAEAPYQDVLIGAYLSTRLNGTSLLIQNSQSPDSWLSGYLIPTPDIGTIGQYYWTSGNDSVYQKIDSNTWQEELGIENAIDSTVENIIDNNIGTKIISQTGYGYTYSYQLTVQPINLNSNVVIQGFKYITTTGQINVVNLTLVPPATGWTIGNYANLALALQMAVNALPDALAIQVTNDDSDIILNVVTAIPAVFTSPNPPTQDSLNPSGLAIGSFISSIQVISPINGAVAEISNWEFTNVFGGALKTLVDTEIANQLAVSSYFTGHIANYGTQVPVDPSIQYGWYTDEATYKHAGDQRSHLSSGQRITFDPQDWLGYIIDTVSYSTAIGQDVTTVTVTGGYTAVQPITGASQLNFITNSITPINAQNQILLQFTVDNNTLPYLSYSNGIFTATGTTRRRYAFGLQLGAHMNYPIYYGANNWPGNLMTEMDIWFQLNNTTVGTNAFRRGQTTWRSGVTSGNTINSYLLSTTWVFDLAPNDTVVCGYWCDVATYLVPIFGNTVNAVRIDVVEV